MPYRTVWTTSAKQTLPVRLSHSGNSRTARLGLAFVPRNSTNIYLVNMSLPFHGLTTTFGGSTEFFSLINVGKSLLLSFRQFLSVCRGKFLTGRRACWYFAMTRVTKSFSITNFQSQFGKFGKSLDVICLQSHTSRAAAATSEVVSLKHLPTPLRIGWTVAYFHCFGSRSVFPVRMFWTAEIRAFFATF